MQLHWRVAPILTMIVNRNISLAVIMNTRIIAVVAGVRVPMSVNNQSVLLVRRASFDAASSRRYNIVPAPRISSAPSCASIATGVSTAGSRSASLWGCLETVRIFELPFLAKSLSHFWGLVLVVVVCKYMGRRVERPVERARNVTARSPPRA